MQAKDLDKRSPFSGHPSPFGSGRPVPKPQPQRDQRNGCANGIEQRVVNGGTSARHKHLVKLIRQGIRRGDEQRAEPPSPPPAGVAPPHRAVEQHEIDEVLRKMRALPDDVMDVVVLALRQPRNQPAHGRLEKPFRMLGGKTVRGHRENHPRPNNRRPPRPQPRNPSRRRSLRANFRQAWCGTRIAPRLRVHGQDSALSNVFKLKHTTFSTCRLLVSRENGL